MGSIMMSTNPPITSGGQFSLGSRPRRLAYSRTWDSGSMTGVASPCALSQSGGDEGMGAAWEGVSEASKEPEGR